MKPTFATPDEVSLQQFRALAAIAQTGSFTLAADALQLTQPAVSHLIKRMEQQLGQPLVVRGRRIRLTDAGQMMADTAQRMDRHTTGILPGQDVLTVPSLVAKLEAQIRGLGCGRLPEPLLRPHVEAGRLVIKRTEQPVAPIVLHYAWRAGPGTGRALAWWLDQLASPVTRRALLEQHAGLIL